MITTTLPPRTAGLIRQNYLVPLLVGLVAVVWFMGLSQWILVAPEGITVLQKDVLFESDASKSLEQLTAQPRPSLPRIFYFVHPLFLYIWRPICLALASLFSLFMPADHAAIMAGRFLIALVAGGGIAGMAFLAAAHRILPRLLLLAVLLACTANVLVALPEHFGLSYGLLALTAVLCIRHQDTRRKVVLLAILTILIAGTTITNGLFPCVCLAYVLHRKGWLPALPNHSKRWIAVAALLAVGIGIAAFFLIPGVASHPYIAGFSNLRLFKHPLEALTYAVSGLTYPIIGPDPMLVAEKTHTILSYEPLRPFHYTGLQALGAISWTLLLGASIIQVLRDDRYRLYALFLLGWILFNVVFHNVWSDEFFLFSPHWVWALMALVILGARHLSPTLVTLAALMILPGQLYTLASIGFALQSL